MNNSFFGNNGGSDAFSGTQIMSQSGGGGGGGYLNTSMTSDMAGGMTPAKRVNPNEPSLLPCTIKQIKNAPAPAQDDSLRVDGKELHNVTIIGRIVHINVESTHTSFTIDDGTGQIDVRVWNAVDDKGDNTNYSDLTQETYVRCIGKVKNYHESRSMTGFSLRKVTDFDEITYHNLEALYAHLINTLPDNAKANLNNMQPNKLNFNNNNNNNNNTNNNDNSNNNNNNNNDNNLNSSFSFGNNNNNNSNNNNNIAGMNNTSMINVNSNNNNNNNNNNNSNNNGGGDMVVDEEMSPLHKKILDVLSNDMHNKDESYSGCHVDSIFNALNSEDRNQIREALEQMSNDGLIYTTYDEETYQIVQG